MKTLFSTLLCLFVFSICSSQGFKDGDVIFQTSRSNQSRVIQEITNSNLTHCGIIFFKDNKPYFVTGRPLIKEEFIEKCKTDSEFSQRWGLKIEERELSLEERYGLSRVNGISPKYSFEIEDGKPTPNKMSESEWYDNHNIPTKLIKVTYNDTKLESYE